MRAAILGSMKKLLLLFILLFTLSCNKDTTETSDPVSDETGTPAVNDGTQTGSTSGGSTTGSTTGGSTTGGTVLPDSNLSWTEQFMDLVNDHRRSIGLRAMIHDEDVQKIATQHSQNMANGTVAFGHTGFSSRCTAARAALGGGNWCGENVAAGQKTPQAAFTSWMNSPGHRANIESSRATHTGFGYAKNSSGKYYWTQLFIEH